jgi:hypothetical protein
VDEFVDAFIAPKFFFFTRKDVVIEKRPSTKVFPVFPELYTHQAKNLKTPTPPAACEIPGSAGVEY